MDCEAHPQKPDFVGIDPFGVLIEENVEDNVALVSVGSTREARSRAELPPSNEPISN